MSPFDNVSLEIYDEIFSQVLCPIEEIQHVYRRVEPDNEDGIHCFDFIRGVGHGNFGYYVRWWPRPSDLRIRLVSKAFDHAMRRAYFHNTDVQLQAYKANSVGCIEKYIISPDSSLPSQMTRLRIELSPGIPWQGMSFFERDLSDQQDFPSARVIYREEMAENHANRHNLLAFLPVIPRAIAKMPKLERLIVNLNEDWRSHGPTWDIPGYISDDDDGEIYGPKIDLVLLDKVRKSIESIFTSPDNSLPFLTYLRLTLPCAYDFTCINKVISDGVATNLRHLYLEYIDGTGPQGDLSYTISCEGGDDNDGSEDYPFSTLQKKYPNIEHNHGIRDLVHRCRNLESLGLAGTQPIDLRNISWQPNRRGLKNIYLCRAIIGHEDFCQLLSSPSSIGTSSHTPSKRVALQMEDVELSSGTFADVWSELITSQCLRYLDLHNLVYCREHPNFLSLRRHNHRPWEIISQIWSEHKPDVKLLASLIRKTQEWGGQVSESMGMFAEDQEEGRGRMQRKVA